ncbi:class I SAM-dependent methyltransferase [bacterium]|nr:class I SAM-dependent methyltransferase [bacterium]
MRTHSINPWDQRYGDAQYYYGTEPNDFLRDHVRVFPVGGEILSLGEGEGRNAVFLSKMGFKVSAVDGSQVGLNKMQVLAARHKVQVTPILADLQNYQIREMSWDGVISIWCHLPRDLRRLVHQSVVRGLRVGGVFLLEAYRPEQLEYKTGGPASVELLMTMSELRQELMGLEWTHCDEIIRDVHEGVGHFGKSAVVQMIGVKRESL